MATAAPKKPVPDRFAIYPWNKMQALEGRRWTIKGILLCGGLSALIGQSGSSKTFLAINFAVHVGQGREWCGRQVRKGPVLIIAAEGGTGIAERLKAYAKLHNLNLDDLDLHILPSPINLCLSTSDADGLARQIASNYEQPFSLIVVDTLNAVMPGADENAPKDMSLLLKNCARLRQKTGAHVMLVHHTGKEEKKGARGHSSLKAALDTEITVKSKDAVTTVVISKQRDGKTGDQFKFDRIDVELGRDEDGDLITSCVLVPQNTQIADHGKAEPPLSALKGGESVALEALREAIKDGMNPR